VKNVKICHVSDWHGNFLPLPRADLYVVTGDMLPNFPLLRIEVDKWRRDGIVMYDPYGHLIGRPQGRPVGVYAGRKIIPEREETLQKMWCGQHPFRREVGLGDDDPVLVVKGNHDFIPLSEWIGGDVWEADDDPTRSTKLLGLKVGGFRGINFIVGEWADELRRAELDERARALPEDLDVLITHSPPYGILDQERECYGSPALASYINRRSYVRNGIELKAHLFGHVHDACGVVERGGTVFSNAATRINLVEI
jgi:Icc-related predicted phosphoesterase